MMSDPQEQEQPAIPPEGVALGGMGQGEYDTSLRAGEGEAAEGAEDQLALPRNGLVAFRKSGGLRFTSRGFVVYRSGWVVPLEGSEGRPRHMTDEARAALEALILRSGLSRTSRRKARGSPDGYAYEITAHYGGRTRYAEVEDGAIPDQLRRLIEVLQRLMPQG